MMSRNLAKLIVSGKAQDPDFRSKASIIRKDQARNAM